jgi:hypothetical protein
MLEVVVVCGMNNNVIFTWLVSLEEVFHTATKQASDS